MTIKKPVGFMPIKKPFVFGLGLSLLLAACASTPGKDQSEAERKAKTEMFFTGMTSQKAQATSEMCSLSGIGVKKQSWQDLVAAANGCVKSGNWPAVDTLAFELSRTNIDSPWGLYYYSLSAEAQKDYARALWMIDAAMKKSTSDVALFRYQKGRVMWLMKPSELALKEVETALKFDPTLADAHEFLGEARLRATDYKSAERHFAEALKLDPTNVRAHRGLAALAIETGTQVASTAPTTAKPAVASAAANGQKSGQTRDLANSSKETKKEGAQK